MGMIVGYIPPKQAEKPVEVVKTETKTEVKATKKPKKTEKEG